jgi:hypothetical protein
MNDTVSISILCVINKKVCKGLIINSLFGKLIVGETFARNEKQVYPVVILSLLSKWEELMLNRQELFTQQVRKKVATKK